MASITETAAQYVDACDTGQGWQGCSQYCLPDAGFSVQSEALADLSTMEAYSDWMQGLLGFMSDASYEVKAFATDTERNSVVAYAVFSGTHTGEGGPCPPTGKSTSTDYVYVMEFEGDKIAHMTKIWHSGMAMQELGWV
jgi:predicted ester cyclase